MKEVIVHPFPTLHTTIHDVPIPTPAPGEVVIKIFVAGSNVKDWLHPQLLKTSLNSGDDMAGTIHALGEGVTGFRVGDRVAGMHRMRGEGGAYAEFGVVREGTTVLLGRGEGVGFEEAATMPLIVLTAAITLFRRQGLPPPWNPVPGSPSLELPLTPTPLIIYGASSALGCFAIKLAKVSNVHPIIAIAGGSKAYVETLLDVSKGDRLVDYRGGVEKMKEDVRDALGGLVARHAVDCISANQTWVPLTQLVDPEGGVVSVVSGASKYDEDEIPKGVRVVYTYVGTVHDGAYLEGMPCQPPDKEEVRGDVEWAGNFVKWFGGAVKRGDMRGHPYEVIDGGLEGVEEGLRKLKGGENKGRKYVYRVVEGEGED